MVVRIPLIREEGANAVRLNCGGVGGQGKREDVEYREPKCVNTFTWVGTRS